VFGQCCSGLAMVLEWVSKELGFYRIQSGQGRGEGNFSRLVVVWMIYDVASMTGHGHCAHFCSHLAGMGHIGLGIWLDLIVVRCLPTMLISV
jgi:hypothetical protein